MLPDFASSVIADLPSQSACNLPSISVGEIKTNFTQKEHLES